uniref:Germin-like protein n=1 Tax=Ananas comosus var. bracteatus TaxID=296719 RepID=A0A6V7PV66_ANACO|nr:unnamed protein product [Ananas comosus var. bracteatus]
MASPFLLLAVLALAFAQALAYDPTPLQTVTVEDFSSSGLNIAGNTKNKFGFNVTFVDVMRVPGLNTLGVSIARADYAHTAPSPSTPTPAPQRLFLKTLHVGDVFAVPIGMIHFEFNVGKGPAVAIAWFNSQNPGIIFIRDAVFRSKPPIPVEVLEKSFQVGKDVIEELMIEELLAQFK